MAARILLIEDNSLWHDIVQSALGTCFSLDIAKNVQDTDFYLQNGTYDLFVVELRLPDSDGFDMFKKIRTIERFRETPVVFLTGSDSVEDKVRSFEMGADDYIVKPFQPSEFKARLAARLKRKHMPAKDVFHLGPFEAFPGTQKICMGTEKKPLNLTAKQFKVLFFLLRNEGRTFSRADILREVWGTQIHISDRTIDSHIYSIRQQLGDLAHCLRSVHGKGYCFSFEAAA